MTDLDSRYGRKPSNGRRNIIVLASVLLAVFFGWSISVNFFTPAAHADYKAEAVRFTETGVNRIAAEIKLTGPSASGTIHCTSKALDTSYALVGFKEFDVKIENQSEKRFELAINTTSAASSIVVEACKLQ
ncbi:MAG: hypothetical protein RL488_298 [Actinomycetota bacterium]